MSQKKIDIRFLDKKETYSVLLSAIYASEGDPKYRLLSDLMYMMDDETFKSFITLFEGQTITVPTLSQLTEMLKALMIYTYRNIQGKDWDTIAKLVGAKTNSENPFRGTPEYKNLINSMKAKNIEVGGVFSDFPSKSVDIN